MHRFFPLFLSIIIHLPLLFIPIQLKKNHAAASPVKISVVQTGGKSSTTAKLVPPSLPAKLPSQNSSKHQANQNSTSKSTAQSDLTQTANGEDSNQIQIPFEALAAGSNFKTPNYPPKALANQIEATLTIKMEINPAGKIINFTWLDEDKKNSPFFEEIKKALADWEFAPIYENQIRTTTKEFIFKIKK